MTEITKEKLEYCWSCRQQKPNVNKEEGTFTSGICEDCTRELNESLRNNNAELVEKDRAPHYSGWHNKTVIIRDASVKRNGEEYFICGFTTCDATYETTKVFNLVKQFIRNNFRFVLFYGNLDKLEKHDFWFSVQKINQFYHFGGNCYNISNAFDLKTLDINQIWKYVEVWSRIPDSLKKKIREQLDKGLVFANTIQHFSREKQFCFKDYAENYRHPKITVLKNFKP